MTRQTGLRLAGMWDAFITLMVIVGVLLATAYVAGCGVRGYKKTAKYIDSKIIIIDLTKDCKQ